MINESLLVNYRLAGICYFKNKKSAYKGRSPTLWLSLMSICQRFRFNQLFQGAVDPGMHSVFRLHRELFIAAILP